MHLKDKRKRETNRVFKKTRNSDGAIDNKESSVSSPTPVVFLQRNVDFLSCLGLSIGSVIGSGIFISPKGVLIGSGSVGVSLIVWLICGIKTLLGALAYSELGTLLPNSGGAYYYQLEAFHSNRKVRSFWGPLPAFLFFWYATFFARPAAFAVQGIAVGHYIIKITSFTGCGPIMSEKTSTIFAKIISVAFIMIITAANCYTNKLSTRLIKIFTLAKLIALAFIIISGLTMLSLGTNESLKTGFEGTSLDGLLLAIYSGSWAYSGWSRVNYIARELVNPKRDVPRCLISTVIIITSIYLLANISYFAVLSKKSFLASDAVAADFADHIIGKPGILVIMISVILSIFGATLGSLFASNRMIYAAAREGHIAQLLCYIHHERMIPNVAIIFTGLLAVLLVPFSSVLGLISLVSFTYSFFFILTMVALLVLRKRRKSNQDTFQVPLVVIFINIITDVGMVIVPFMNPKIEFILVAAFSIGGVVVYTLFVYFRKTIKGIERITVIVQKILLIVHPEDDDV